MLNTILLLWVNQNYFLKNLEYLLYNVIITIKNNKSVNKISEKTM